MSKEIMQQALAYIKDIRDHCACEGIDCEEETDLVVALEQELAKPEKEPKLSDAGAETNITRGLEPKGSGMVTLNQVGMRVDFNDAPPRKEWVGLSVNEGRDFFESKLTRAELIADINEFLEDKNNAV